MMDIIREIFSGKELTLNKSSAILCKYSRVHESIDIPLRIANYLINNECLVEDSGNWDTGDVHYIFNHDRKTYFEDIDPIFEQLKPILREVRLNKLIR